MMTGIATPHLPATTKVRVCYSFSQFAWLFLQLDKDNVSCSNLLVNVNTSVGLSVILRGRALVCLKLRILPLTTLSFCWNTAEVYKLIMNLISSSQHKVDPKIAPGSCPHPPDPTRNTALWPTAPGNTALWPTAPSRVLGHHCCCLGKK